MSNSIIKTNLYNQVYIYGKIVSDLSYSFSFKNEKFFKFMVEVVSVSGYVDILPVEIALSLISEKIRKGEYISANGQYRSFDSGGGIFSRLVLTIMVTELFEKQLGKMSNQVLLYGFLCRFPSMYRHENKTTKTDLMLSVSRTNSAKRDHIPVATWQKNAIFADTLTVGEPVLVVGRIISRQYTKTVSNKLVTNTRYEVRAKLIESMSKYNEEETKKLLEFVYTFPKE